MIVRSKPSAWELIGIWRLSILPRIAGQLFAVLLFSTGVVWSERRFPQAFHSWTVAPFTLLGVALSIFLGFRNSACYDRWWEARRQLGALIGEMRAYARLILALPGADTDVDRARRREAVEGAMAFFSALVSHLRGEPVSELVCAYLPAMASESHVSDRLLRRLAGLHAAMLAAGEIGEQTFLALEARTASFSAIQVACERIRGTPTPFTYTLLLHRTAYAYCFLLPFGLASTMGYATALFCTLVAYAFFGLDALGDELEEPFGTSLNALPLHAMARTVEISLRDALGESPLPAALEPIRSVLL